MNDIVRKMADGGPAADAPVAGSPMEIRIHVTAEALEKMKKRAVVRGMRADASSWEMVCDEGARVGGDDEAPPPLAYYSAGIAFWLLTQLSRYGEMAKLKVKSIRVEQVTRFFREGSMMLGTIRSGCLGVESTVEIESDEPVEKIQKMMRVGESSCFTMGSLTAVVPTKTNLNLNGKPLEFKEG